MKTVLIDAIQMFGFVLNVLIFIRVIMSWIPNLNRNSFLPDLIYRLTEPLMAPIRRMLHNSPLGGPGMMMDFSPIIVIFAIEIISGILINIIVRTL